jgi:bifunctional non-homologous end joining protein LigD
MTDLLARLEKRDRELLEPVAAAWRSPMLASLTSRRFSDPDWLFERKLDGERALALRVGDRVELVSRNRKRLDASYPEVIDGLAGQPCRNFAADGEVVAFEGGLTSFARLQRRMQIAEPGRARASGVAVYYYVFDLIHLEGYDLTRLPLRRRKALLRDALDYEDPIRFTPHRNAAGEAYFHAACQKGWEGVIAKRASAPYRHGRSSDWLKFKCARGQELVIGGFTAPKGSRKGLGALLLGYYDDGALRYAGKVGTGFDDEMLVDLRRRLDGMTLAASPYADRVREPGVRFVEPELVAEIAFTEWTADGRLRHPRFLGLRRDKAAKEIRRESAEA